MLVQHLQSLEKCNMNNARRWTEGLPNALTLPIPDNNTNLPDTVVVVIRGSDPCR